MGLYNKVFIRIHIFYEKYRVRRVHDNVQLHEFIVLFIIHDSQTEIV